MRLTELLLNFQQLGPHPFADRFALQDHEGPVPVLPADVRESQKVERLGLSFSSLFPVSSRQTARTQSGASCPGVVPVRTSAAVSQISRNRSASARCSKPEDIVIRVSDDNDVASRALLAPGVHPQVEHVMQIDVRKQRRSHRSLWCPLRSSSSHSLGFQVLNPSRRLRMGGGPPNQTGCRNREDEKVAAGSTSTDRCGPRK